MSFLTCSTLPPALHFSFCAGSIVDAIDKRPWLVKGLKSWSLADCFCPTRTPQFSRDLQRKSVLLLLLHFINSSLQCNDLHRRIHPPARSTSLRGSSSHPITTVNPPEGPKYKLPHPPNLSRQTLRLPRPPHRGRLNAKKKAQRLHHQRPKHKN